MRAPDEPDPRGEEREAEDLDREYGRWRRWQDWRVDVTTEDEEIAFYNRTRGPVQRRGECEWQDKRSATEDAERGVS